MVHQRPERVEEHERQRSVFRIACPLYLPAPSSVSGPPPSSLPLYPSSGLPRPPPSSLSFPLKRRPTTAVPPTLLLRSPAPLVPFLCSTSSVTFAFPLPYRLAAHPVLLLSLTFKWFDDLEFVWQVGPSRGPQVEVAKGHDAFRGGQNALLPQRFLQSTVSSSSPLPLLFEEASLAQIVLSTQRQAPQGQPQIFSPVRFLLSALCAAARAELKQSKDRCFSVDQCQNQCDSLLTFSKDATGCFSITL